MPENTNTIKASRWLWEYLSTYDIVEKELGYKPSPEENLGRTYERLGYPTIVSDTNENETLTQREAQSIYGRNMELLHEAFDLGSWDLFKFCCTTQQISDDAYHAEKERLEAEEAAKAEAEKAEEAKD